MISPGPAAPSSRTGSASVSPTGNTVAIGSAAACPRPRSRGGAPAGRAVAGRALDVLTDRQGRLDRALGQLVEGARQPERPQGERWRDVEAHAPEARDLLGDAPLPAQDLGPGIVVREAGALDARPGHLDR